MHARAAELFSRAAALEQHQLRLERLRRLTPGQLYALLAGDPGEAAAWVRAAAESGMAAAQVRLGRLLLEGQGLGRDPRAAFGWFSRAAQQADADGMNMVGRCYEMGWGVAADLSLAAVYYRSAAEAGYDWAQYNLANLLFDGRGVARDLRSAYLWLVRASQQGHARAMNLLARCLEEGWGCHRNRSEAGYWFERSAAAGYFRAQYNHAIELLRRGHRAQAAEWLWKAVLAGDAAMRRTVAQLLTQLSENSLSDHSLRRLALRVAALVA